MESLLFLLNVLLDLTDELDVFWRSFAASSKHFSFFVFYLAYQINFPLPHPGY